MASVSTKFYVSRNYTVRHNGIFGDAHVMNSCFSDTPEGKAKAQTMCAELQKANDADQSGAKPKKGKK